MAGAAVPYNPVPTQQESGNLGGGFSVQSSPKDMGAQVGASMEKAGNAAFELAEKQQGMINDTAITSADTQLAIQAGKLNGEYKSLSGMAAYAAYPKYQTDLATLRDSMRSQLPAGAQKGFDTLSMRTIANHIIDGSSYAASQLKDANRDSYSSSNDVHLQQILNPSVAASDEEFGHNLGVIKYNTAAQLDDDHPGLKKDPETGAVNFDESTEAGRTLKEEFQQRLDTNLSQAYVNRYDTLAKQDVFGAYDKYKENRDAMPKSAQVALDSSFAPRIFDAHKQVATKNTLVEAQREHFDALTNPSSKSAIDTVLKNEGGLSPDGHAIYGIDKNAYPEEFAKASAMSPDEGKKYAENFYKQEFYDKRGIADLPAGTQNIVMDGVVNHYSEFGDKLIAAAKNGATPQELVDMRRNEYQRLAISNPEKYGDYLNGWNNRLDNLEVATEGKKTYATNENGGPMTLADYYRTNSRDILAKGDAYAESQMPGDLSLKRLVRQTLNNEMNKTISNESAQHLMDNRNIMRAINGDFTKGKPPETEAELRSLPGMNDLLDNISARDPKFAETIPTLIEKMARRNDVTNSENGYETILRTLQPYPNSNRIASQDHLVKLLGRSDGTGINMKDYNDAKQGVDLDDTLKTTISKHMVDITNANGNIDGKGQERALAWYNQAMKAWKDNEAMGEKGLSPVAFTASLGEKDGPPMPAPPSRMQQISNWASELGKSKDKIPTFSSWEDAEFQKLPSGAKFMVPGEKVPRTKK